MCGICGIFRSRDEGKWESHRLNAMTEALFHRGPDDDGYFQNGLIAFGHRRLSIIDLETGAQPMANEDESVWIVFNGEIYNHLELRQRLEKKGYRYRTRSDTESILHLYQDKGIDCLEDLEGMFAFAIWDQERRRLFLARDRLGKKPLYYFQSNGYFVFGSEIKSLLENPFCPRELDESSLYYYLTFAFTPPPYTLFKGICKLPPAHYLLVNDPAMAPSPVRYWNPLERLADTRKGMTEDDAAEHVRALLSQSVRARMISDVPFGVFLSGGIDSSTNVALMSEHMSGPVQTFSVGYKKDDAFNELDYARRVARVFKTDHHEIIIDQKDLTEHITEIIYSQDEPIADPVCFPLYFVSKLARENGVIVVQIGEGSDEIFCGYPRYMIILRLALLNNRVFQTFPEPLRRAVYAFAAPILKGLGRTKELEYLRRGAVSQEVFWGGAVAFGDVEKDLLLSDDYRSRIGPLDSYSILKNYHEIFSHWAPSGDELDKMIYIDLVLRLPELLLMRVDKMCMATSVEARTPFLDHRLVEYALAIPRAIKIKNGTTKHILRKAVHGLIPEDIIHRRKQGFDVPIKSWLRGKFQNFFTQSLLNSSLRKRDIIDYGYVRQLLDLHRGGKRDYSFLLWNLFNLTLWYDLWIEKSSGLDFSGR
jgi:asparagine synthase (glutamine-hydrolysing)